MQCLKAVKTGNIFFLQNKYHKVLILKGDEVNDIIYDMVLFQIINPINKKQFFFCRVCLITMPRNQYVSSSGVSVKNIFFK